MEQTIHLGFEVGTGHAVAIPVAHMAVTGQTQQSGKTTTLEALISRSEARAVAFVTKRGEGAFDEGRQIRPYFRERADWHFVESILESAMRQRMKFERAWIVRASKGAKTLADVRQNVRSLQAKSKRSMDQDIYMLLGEYLDLVVPLIAKLPASPTVDLRQGLNVMDLGAYPAELQALVIQSVLAWVYQNEKDVITVIPEAWQFIPQGRGSPVKMAAIDLARKGAGLRNFMWIDSQDLAGVEKEVIRQASVWLLGVQREANEIKRTLAHIPAGIKKPKPEDIATLGVGQFWACWRGTAIKTYVQPEWMLSGQAEAYAQGELELDTGPRRPTRSPPPTPESEPIIDEGDMTSDQEAKLDQILDLMITDREHAAKAHKNGAGTTAVSANVPVGEVAGYVPPNEDELYKRFKARLVKDAPAILKVLTIKPELEVTVERQTVQVDGKSLRGRLAQMIAQGWFDDTQSASAAYTELRRNGLSVAKPGVYKEMDNLAGIGIVTKEDGGYRVAPGAKVNIIGAGRR